MTKKWKTSYTNWTKLFLTILLVLLFSNIIFPITYDDDFAYSQLGNPFLLQWGEYISWHGRMITHSLARTILQWGFPYTDIFASLFTIGFFFICCISVTSKFWIKEFSKEFPLILILLLVLYSFVPMSSTAYSQTVFFMSNFFAIGLVLLFLIPYANLISEKNIIFNKYQLVLISISGFLAGAAHEQASAVLPLLILLWVYLRQRKQIIPSWFWIGIFFLIIGMFFIHLSPGSASRIISYARADQWDFMGKTIDWTSLGVKRYFYALFHHLFLNKISAYIPNTIIYYLLIGFLYIKNAKKVGVAHSEMVRAVFYLISSLGFTFIMMFSPLFYQANLIWGLVPLYISLFILARLFYQLYQPKLKALTLAKIMMAVFIVIWGVQVLAWNHYRKEYKQVVLLINKAKEQNLSEVIVPSFTQYTIKTPLGNILPVYLYRTDTFYTRMAEYYKISKITVE
ncbi:MAG: DUF6056 family protein [Brevinema sp.]